jgi:Gamma-glutamyl cyclotransferase, AIG2-like
MPKTVRAERKLRPTTLTQSKELFLLILKQSERDEQMPTEFLFSYGTLQLEAVQMATFGRQLTGKRDVLPGFEEIFLEIDDGATISLSGKARHSMAKFTGRSSDTVSGTVYAVTPEEIQSADRYEVAAYQRMAVVLQSGIRAWVYVDARYAPST